MAWEGGEAETSTNAAGLVEWGKVDFAAYREASGGQRLCRLK